MKVNHKLAGGGFAGALVAVALWGLDVFAHLKVPEEIASAITVVIAFIVGYFVPEAAQPIKEKTSVKQ